MLKFEISRIKEESNSIFQARLLRAAFNIAYGHFLTLTNETGEKLT
jgi:hypothetical protein